MWTEFFDLYNEGERCTPYDVIFIQLSQKEAEKALLERYDNISLDNFDIVVHKKLDLDNYAGMNYLILWLDDFVVIG